MYKQNTEDQFQLKQEFLENLLAVLENYSRKEKICLVVGGGLLARKLIRLANFADQEFKDLLGIEATRINSLIIKKIFEQRFHLSPILFSPRKDVHDFSQIIPDIKRFIEDNEHVRIYLFHGILPAATTDYDSVVLAKLLNIDEVYNFTDVDYIYEDYPKNNKPIITISFIDLFEKFKINYSSGMHFPFDPKALKFAFVNKIKIKILNGNKLELVKQALNGNFIGTLIY